MNGAFGRGVNKGIVFFALFTGEGDEMREFAKKVGVGKEEKKKSYTVKETFFRMEVRVM